MSDPEENGSPSRRAGTDTVRSLSLITVGQPGEFGDHEEPPPTIQSWVRHANLRQVRGLLLHALHRWHLLRER